MVFAASVDGNKWINGRLFHHNLCLPPREPNGHRRPGIEPQIVRLDPIAEDSRRSPPCAM